MTRNSVCNLCGSTALKQHRPSCANMPLCLTRRGPMEAPTLLKAIDFKKWPTIFASLSLKQRINHTLPNTDPQTSAPCVCWEADFISLSKLVRLMKGCLREWSLWGVCDESRWTSGGDLVQMEFDWVTACMMIRRRLLTFVVLMALLSRCELVHNYAELVISTSYTLHFYRRIMRENQAGMQNLNRAFDFGRVNLWNNEHSAKIFRGETKSFFFVFFSSCNHIPVHIFKCFSLRITKATFVWLKML